MLFCTVRSSMESAKPFTALRIAKKRLLVSMEGVFTNITPTYIQIISINLRNPRMYKSSPLNFPQHKCIITQL